MFGKRLLVFAVVLACAACAVPPANEPPPIMAKPVTLESGETVVPQARKDGQAGMRGIQLAKVQFTIPRGKVIGQPNLVLCDMRPAAAVHHEGQRNVERPREWQETFAKIMSGHGHHVPRESHEMFTTVSQAGSDLLVGANVTDFYLETWISCIPMTRAMTSMRAKATITVDWQVFDPVRNEVVLRLENSGRYESDRNLPLDADMPMQLVFADAANNLAANPQFRALLAALPSRSGPDGASRHSLSPLPLSQKPIDEIGDAVRSATVLIEVGEGRHGSGFLVSTSGLLVTNAHVVGGQNFVRVRLLSGRVVVGEVLRVDARRDVALIRLEGGGYPALPVRKAPVRAAEEVYAIGAPQMKALAWTVTRGVVSAYRQAMPPEQLDYIQADVAVHGGNSGGPLLDRHGNVVGICVAGIAMDESQRNASLNLFIPIMDGLERLGLSLGGPAAGKETAKAE